MKLKVIQNNCLYVSRFRFINLKKQKFIEENFDHKVDSYFLSNKSNLDKVVYSLLRISDSFQANEFYLRIQEGEANFGDLSYEFSEGPEKLTRGIVGPVPSSQGHPLVNEKLQSLKVGELVEPFKIGNQSILLRLEARVTAKLDKETRTALGQELFEKWIQELSMAKIDSITEIAESNN